jgi:hypothetical protein
VKYTIAAILLLFGGCSIVIVKTAHDAAASRHTKTLPEIRLTIGPDVSHCFSEEEERSLWDCIRHKV